MVHALITNSTRGFLFIYVCENQRPLSTCAHRQMEVLSWPTETVLEGKIMISTSSNKRKLFGKHSLNIQIYQEIK